MRLRESIRKRWGERLCAIKRNHNREREREREGERGRERERERESVCD